MSLHGPMASVCSDAATRPELNVAHSDFFQREPLVDPVSPVVISCFDGQSKANIGVKTRGRTMRRRDFVKAIGGAAASWSLPARAQERMRRIGVLMNIAADDQQAQLYLGAFQQGLQELGWTVGRNLRIEQRWGPSNEERIRQQAAELVAFAPDVILWAGQGGQSIRQVSRTVPVVLAQSIDPVGQGLVASLARPAGNITGFTQFEYGLSGKWLQLFKEIAPDVTRVGVLRGPDAVAGIGPWAVIQAFAEPIGVECTPLSVNDPNEIERSIAAFERGGPGGLIITLNALATSHRQTIIASAARHRLPAIYPMRYFAEAGGLVSYGADLTDQYRRAAGYVDRILRGDKPADLPVQKATKYELTINLKTAKALGLDVPASVLVRADEVIE
jgi:putative tryptophan/tyrosine transport system substrate-binding protein